MDTYNEFPHLVVRMPRSLSGIKLPPGWIGVNHKSGGVVYMHKETRVVTWSRPYCIDKEASLRKHEVPLYSIPCLHQKLKTYDRTVLKRKPEDDTCTTPVKKAWPNGVNADVPLNRLSQPLCESMFKQKDQERSIAKQSKDDEQQRNSNLDVLSTSLNQTPKLFSPHRSGSAESSPMSCHSQGQLDDLIIGKSLHNLESITPQLLHEYLNKIFQFDVLSDNEARSVLFTGDDQAQTPQQTSQKKKNRLIVDGKTPIQILNEYCQGELRAEMKFQQIDTGLHADFIVEVVINDLKYGIGTGDTIKQAKHRAAQVTLDILEPKLFSKPDDTREFKALDDVPIDDISILTAKDEKDESPTLPYSIMLKLLGRYYINPRFSRSEAIITVTKLEEQKYQYEMKCRDFVTQGICEKRNLVKQMGAQSIICQLYPTLKCWGSVLRLSQVEVPQDLAAPKGDSLPTRNEVIMHALKNEMRKINSPK